jgi:hypothetical protein
MSTTRETSLDALWDRDSSKLFATPPLTDLSPDVAPTSQEEISTSVVDRQPELPREEIAKRSEAVRPEGLGTQMLGDLMNWSIGAIFSVLFDD